MPDVSRLYERFAGRDDFALVAITKDTEKTLPKLQELVHQRRPKYPVLWLGKQDHITQGLRRYVSAVPTYLLVNPDGLIIRQIHISDELPDTLQKILDHPAPLLPVRIDTRHELQSDCSLEVTVEIDNPYAETLPVSLSAGYNVSVYVPELDRDNTGEKNANRFYDLEGGSLGEFAATSGRSSFSFTVPDRADGHAVQYTVSVTLPGTEGFTPEGGLTMSTHEFVWTRSK